MPELQISQLTSAESTSQQDGEDRSVTFAFERIWIWRLPEATSLISGEPVSEPHAQLLDTFHTPNASGQLGAEQARISSFVDEMPDSSGRPSMIPAARCRFSR
jgi:hypothetical protein